jgi:signal transduction histidine kinase
MIDDANRMGLPTAAREPELEWGSIGTLRADRRRPSSVHTDPEAFGTIMELTRAFASTRDVDEATASIARWVRTAVGREATIRLSLRDRVGRLRAVVSEGALGDYGRKSSARRRAAFNQKTPKLIVVQEPGTQALALIPLVCRSEAVGILEVRARWTELEASWSVLVAIASQAAIVVRNIQERTELLAARDTLDATALFARDLVRAENARSTVHRTVSFCFERLRVPVAGWLPDEIGAHPRLVLARGISRGRMRYLTQMLATLPQWQTSSLTDREALYREFGRLCQAEDVEVREAGGAVLFIAGWSPHSRRALDGIVALLADSLEFRTTIEQARRRNADLDLALAWTAHDLREPLIGVRAAIDRLLMSANLDGTGGSSSGDVEMWTTWLDGIGSLRRSRDALDTLMDTVESSLRWAAARPSLQVAEVSIVEIVEDAARSIAFDDDIGRISLSLSVEDHPGVDGPSRGLPARPDWNLTRADRGGQEGTEASSRGPRMEAGWTVVADRIQLARAISNVISNALAYSPKDRPVSVDISAAENGFVVTVADQGPGILPMELSSIFDPFVRGSAKSSHRGGHGLGLFIAKRIVDAHGGRAWIESNPARTAVRIMIPRAIIGDDPHHDRGLDGASSAGDPGSSPGATSTVIQGEVVPMPTFPREAPTGLMRR